VVDEFRNYCLISPVIDSKKIKEILAVVSQLPKRLGLVGDFRTFRIEKADPEFMKFLAA